jgi:imidazolonepropionase-like amidohydrolase
MPDAPWRTPPGQAGKAERNSKGPTVLLRGARVLIGDGTELARGHVLIAGGRIASVGSSDGPVPLGATIIDARGKTITPGLIDPHSHLGVYPMPSVRAHWDGNEMADPVTPGVRAIDAFWPQDPGVQRAVAGGVTTVQSLPGSANLFGGHGVTLKLRQATTAQAMELVGAPTSLKMACGENPKRTYGERKQKPMTRMGNLAVQREAFMKARRLIQEWDRWRGVEKQRVERHADALSETQTKRAHRRSKRDECANGIHDPQQCAEWERVWHDAPLTDPDPPLADLPPARNPDLETLAGVLEGTILPHVHCYRADDMANMIALADEVGFQIRTFEHALEAYKIRGLLAERQIAVITWADWWGFKMEAYDGIPENLALITAAGGRAVLHSDSHEGIRRLNQEAAKGMYAGRQVGLDISEAEAITWITLNPAWALGVDQRVGSLKVGKDADVVVWDGNPFSVYSRAERVFIDGVERHNLHKPSKPWSDFEAAP